MTFTAPLGLLALLAVPAVIVLHLFRHRLPERRVAALFLFAQERLIADAGRKRTRLLNTPSLWLQCLAAVLLALWLGGMSFGGVEARHLVLVLDDSASMSAGTTRQRVVGMVRERVQQLAAGDLVTVLRSGTQPTMLLGPRARTDAVDEALARWRPSRPRHDFGPTLLLARELARDGQVLLFSDEAPPPGSNDCTWIACGQASGNCAILTTDRVPLEHGGEELHARIAAFGAVAATSLSLFDGDRELMRQPLEFRDGLADLVVPLPADGTALRLQLSPDTMPIDDVVWLLPPSSQVVQVCNLLPDNLQSSLQWSRLMAALPVRAVGDPRQAQLLVATQPGLLLPGQTEIVVATGAGERRLVRGPFVIDRAHEWLQGVELHGVTWCFASRSLPGQVLIAAGGEALASEEFLDVGRRLWLSADASAGNLPRAPDWPILLANVVESCRRAVPGPADRNVRLWTEAIYRRSPSDFGLGRELVLVTPDGERRELAGQLAGTANDAILAFVPEQVGVHRLLGKGDTELARYAARFLDASESDLRGLCTLQRDAVAGEVDDRTSVARDTSFERRLLAILLLCVVLIDWLLAARRSG